MKGRSSGYTLVEVLITLVIMAVGLIGILSLHSRVKIATLDNDQYLSANLLAADLITRIQVNPDADYVGTYNSVIALPTVQCLHATTLNNCTPQQLQQWQLYYWLRQLFGYNNLIGDTPIAILNKPTVCISKVDNLVTLVITWQSLATKVDTAANDADASSCGSSSNNRKFIKLSGVV